MPARSGAAWRVTRRFIARLARHEHPHDHAVDHNVLATLERLDTRLANAEVALAALASQGHERRRVEAAWSSDSLPSSGAGGTGAPLRVDTDLGPMLFPPGDKVVTPYVQKYGVWEPEECAALRDLLRPGMTFVDVGAHVGYLTLLAAQAVGPTGRGLAVEPEGRNFSLLAANLMAHGAQRVVPVHAAAWSHSAHVRLRLSSDNSGDHRVREDDTDGPWAPNTQTVPAVALDDLIPLDIAVDVVKIDTQGRDHLVVRGMEKTLARSSATLLVEFWPPGITELGDDPLAVLSYYRSLGYRLDVLGDARDPSPAGSSSDAVLAAAAGTPGGYVTLVLTGRDPAPESI